MKGVAAPSIAASLGRMKREKPVAVIAAWGALLAVAAPACAQRMVLPTPSALAANLVRSYFDALRHLDERALHAVTAGQATERTSEVLDRLHTEAREHRVGLELKVSKLAVVPQPDEGATTPVEVKFDIAVVAKKWFFSTVARQLQGRATFYIGKNLARGDVSGAKIVGIKFYFD